MKTLFFSILICFTLFACDIIDTRKPESPNTSRNSIIAATTPDILFSNLKNAYFEKVVENYMVSFVDNAFLNRQFKFIPDGSSSQLFNFLNNWTKTDEEQFFKHLTSKTGDAPISIDFIEKDKNIMGDSAIFQYDYTITFPIQDESIPTFYEGSSLFKILIDSQQNWVIVSWEDVKKGDSPTWSELKGRFYL